MAAPTFRSVGALATAVSATVAVAYPAGLAAGDLLILSTRGNAGTITGLSAPGFTTLKSTNVGGTAVAWSVLWAIATGSESGTVTVTQTGTSISRTSGQMACYTGNQTTGTPFEAANSNNAISTAPAPASITTTGPDRLAAAAIMVSAATTITAISGASGGTWSESAAAQTGTAVLSDFQQATLASATTLSGGTATIGTSANWCVTTFAILSLPSDMPPAVLEDGSDDATKLWEDQAFEAVYAGETGSTNAIIPDFPEDFILGVEFENFSEPPDNTDWNDWSWAQAPPIDDFPEDFLLGVWDGTQEFDDPSLTDTTDYSSYTDPPIPDQIDPSQLGITEDASQYDDPSFTDFFPYETQTDVLSDDAEPPIDVVKDATQEFDDPSLTDFFDYGTQSDPLSDDIGGDPSPASIDDGTTLPDPSWADTEPYSSQTDPTPADVEEQPIAQVWDGTREWEDPSLSDLTDYSTYTDPLSPDAPLAPIPFIEASDQYEDPSFTDFTDYSSVTPPPIPPAPPVPPVVPTASPCLRVYVNGPPPISACNLNTFEQTCDTVAQLRELIGTPGLQVLVRGLYAVGDGRGGPFVWSATQIGGDDGLTIIFPVGGASTGAWVRQGWLSVTEQFLPLAAAPSTNPNGGFIYIGGDGMLHYLSPNGTDTVIAPA